MSSCSCCDCSSETDGMAPGGDGAAQALPTACGTRPAGSSPGVASTLAGSPTSRYAGSAFSDDSIAYLFRGDAAGGAGGGQPDGADGGADAAQQEEGEGGPGSVLPADADFIIYEWKTRDCPLGEEEHDWSTCVFAHPGEKSRRRSPANRAYNALCCPDVRRRGRCPRGDTCPFAHSVFEIHLHPARFRTKMCRDGTKCSRAVCFFAHTPEDLRVPSPEDLAVLEQRRAAAQQLAAQRDQQQAAQDQTQQQLPGGKGAAKPAAPLPAPKPAQGCRTKRAQGPPPAPAARRDEIAHARQRVCAHLLSLRAQQERADMLRAAADCGAALPGMVPGAAPAAGVADSLMGAGWQPGCDAAPWLGSAAAREAPLFGSAIPGAGLAQHLGSAVSAAMASACGLCVPPPVGGDYAVGPGDYALLGEGVPALSPALAAAAMGARFDAPLLAAAATGLPPLSLAPPHAAPGALGGAGWHGRASGNPVWPSRPHNVPLALPSFPTLW